MQYLDEVPRRLVPRVLIVVGTFKASNLWRAWWPSGYLSRKGFIVDFCTQQEFNANGKFIVESGRYNLFVTLRSGFGSKQAFERWYGWIKNAGLTWVYDTDDDLFSEDFPGYQSRALVGSSLEATEQEFEQQRQNRIDLIRQVDAITVTNKRLAATIRRFTDKPVAILPNGIHVEAFTEQVGIGDRLVEPLTIGWSGTIRGQEDLEPVAKAWAAVAKTHPDVHFVVQGWPAPVLCSSVPTSRLHVLPMVEVSDYPCMLKNIDIMCCSVADTKWNYQKTPIKWMEATLAGATCVVSKPLYGEYVEHGLTGLVARDWHEQLINLIDDPALRHDLRCNARSVVEQKHSLQHHTETWLSEWSNILRSAILCYPEKLLVA